MNIKTMTTLKISVDSSKTYTPAWEDEIEFLVSEEQLNSPIYQHAYDKTKKQLDIIYRKPVQTLHGMRLYKLMHFTMKNGRFDLTAFKSFFAACFPEAKISRLTMADMQELCHAMIKHMMKKAK